MGKKKREEKKEEPKTGFFDSLKQKMGIIFSGVGAVLDEGLKTGAQVGVEFLHRKLEELKRYIRRKITYTLMLFTGLFFILYGIALLLVEYLKLPQSYAFLLIGIIMVIASYVYNSGGDPV